MSWFVNWQNVSGKNPEEDLSLDKSSAKDVYKNWHDYSVDQVYVAMAAAVLIIKSRAIGSLNKSFTVGLSGHANPDHEPDKGFSNDLISVIVTQND